MTVPPDAWFVREWPPILLLAAPATEIHRRGPARADSQRHASGAHPRGIRAAAPAAFAPDPQAGSDSRERLALNKLSRARL